MLQESLQFQSALNTFLDPSGMDAQDEVQEIPAPPTTTASQPPVTTGTGTGSQPPTLREIASGGQPLSRDPPRYFFHSHFCKKVIVKGYEWTFLQKNVDFGDCDRWV